MPDLKDQEEIDAYYLADPTQPRAAGIMWPALVERRIDRLFETALRPDKQVRNELFQPSGALGNYAVKVRLAYMLGWIGKDVYDDLLLIARIRNRFAHTIEAKDFSDGKITAWLRNMTVYKYLPTMLNKAKEDASSNPTAVNMARVLIIEDAIGDGQMGFRFCIDMMLRHIDRCRANMEKNLSCLPGNWSVADSSAIASAAGGDAVSLEES